MDLYDLGHVPWLDSQLIYHALPRAKQEGLILLAPAEPYVCIGFHQDAWQEVDLDVCRELNIPVFRREVGGGAVYLDGRQLFYQLVLHRDNPLAQGNKSALYRRLLEPVAQTYRQVGVDAVYKPVNDIVTQEGRKIAGTGAAELEDYVVLVGNVIFDFDYETMVRVLRVPDEKYRDKVYKSMTENLTTLTRELGDSPDWEQTTELLKANYAGILGPLTPTDLSQPVLDKMDELRQTHTTEDWLMNQSRPAGLGRRVKISSTASVRHNVHKAPGGLIRATLEVKDERIVAIDLSGDFFFYPRESVADLENRLEGQPLEQVPAMVRDFYDTGHAETPGITPENLVVAILGSKK
jgi:lipoate-protein ligase A